MRCATLILLAGLVTGCQMPGNIKQTITDAVSPPPVVAEKPDCYIGAKRLSGLLVQERSYLATTAKRRTDMLAQADKAGDHAQSALLLSQPSANRTELKKALKYFSKQAVRPSLECPGDRYLVLRQRQAELQLRMFSQRDAVREENAALRRQIEELTQIEQDISRDRGPAR